MVRNWVAACCGVVLRTIVDKGWVFGCLCVEALDKAAGALAARNGVVEEENEDEDAAGGVVGDDPDELEIHLVLQQGSQRYVMRQLCAHVFGFCLITWGEIYI